jgi:hypothetical protein
MSARAWYREPMLALVIGLPAAAVAAGIATLVLAARGPDDSGDARVRRVAQTQNVDLAPDRAAAAIGLAAVATLDTDGAILLRFDAAAPDADSLAMTFRHVADASRDRAATLLSAGNGVFAGRLDAPRAAGSYNVELVPADSGWRLVGRLDAASARLALESALGN